MLIDLHAHSSGISQCCRIPYDQILQQARDNGIDGIVLTNHYQESYIQNGDISAFVEKYIAEFQAANAYGKRIGVSVLFGVEVTMTQYPNVHLLIYGVDPDFLRAYPTVFALTQEQLYRLVKSHHGLLIQAHPFRNHATVLDTHYLDGVEINCHPLYGNSYSGELIRIACDNHLLLTCGGDYHADTYRPKCGMYLPDTVTDTHTLCSYLLSPGEKQLCVQEPNTDTCITIRYDWDAHTVQEDPS